MKKPAKVLRDHVEEIMELWDNEVKKKVPAANKTNAIALYDHLPNIIHDIADIFERYLKNDDLSKDNKYAAILGNSEYHGRHRAATNNYTSEQVVQEYMIFQRTLAQFLKSQNAFNGNTPELLSYIIETAILKSVASFSLSIQQMQEKLIGTLAHDIRNPLSAAQLSLEMLKDADNDNLKEKMHAAVQRSIKKALSLTEGLMNGITVKAGEGMMLDFEEKDILQDILWVYEEAKEVHVNEIILEARKKPIKGVFDGTAIRRLLENLIGNAVKYGSVKHPITINVTDKKERVEIMIHNFGKPISVEQQKHIFDFLKREEKDDKTAGKSWGMGLTLVQIVAEAHGGEINLTSNEEDGTSFIVTLLKNANKPGQKRTKLTFIEGQN